MWRRWWVGEVGGCILCDVFVSHWGLCDMGRSFRRCKLRVSLRIYILPNLKQ